MSNLVAVQDIEAVPAILEVICNTTGMGFAAVARVTESRWIACAVRDQIGFGLDFGGELPLETTICNEIRSSQQDIVIDHVAEDADYSNHPTPITYGFQSYISVPIILASGEMFGTLCAIDPRPRNLKNSGVLAMFRLFAQLIAFHLDANGRLNQFRSDLRTSTAALVTSQNDLVSSRAELAQKESHSELREQFIAILGHDLRNPLAGIEGGRRMLAKSAKDPKDIRVLRLMGESVSRMSGLIDNLMDFARGRLGGGIGLQISKGQRLEPLLAQVVNEIKSGHPDREVNMKLDLGEAVDVDHGRIAQMFSNLLGNAITHGAKDDPIFVNAWIENAYLHLSVANGGERIPTEIVEKLFQPFQRGSGQSRLQGLGLGLYIASQIAQAHGGRIDVASNHEETRFTFRMPV